MKILVLGPGCMKCHKLFDEAEKAVADTGLSVQLEKVEKIDEVMKHGVMITPALIIDGKVKCSGRVPKAVEIAGWIREAAG
jgi:small redox-active disulfide protein 2